MKRLSSYKLLCLLVGCLALSSWASTAQANSALFNFYDFPFFDGGFPEGGPDIGNVQGFQVAPIYDVGRHLSGNDRRLVPGPNQTDTMVMLFQWVWFYPWQPENKHFTLTSDLFFSYGATHVDQPGLTSPTFPSGTSEPGLGVGGGGVGDVLWTPAGIGIAYQHWQYEDWFKPTFYISPLISFPAGEFDVGDPFPGLGSGAWSVVPAFIGWSYLGKNFGPLEGTEWQLDFIYSHTFERNGTTQVGPGDAMVLNNAFLFPVLRDLKAGIAESYVQTLSRTDIAGVPISHYEAQEVGLGPAFMWHVGPVNFWLSALFDIMTKNQYHQWGFYLTGDYAFPASALLNSDELPSWMRK